MKKVILLLLVLCGRISVKAQQGLTIDEEKSSYAFIKDEDGFANIRCAPSNTALITGRIVKYQMFMVQPNKTSWWKVLQVLHDKDYKTDFLEGYIHKSRVSILPKSKPKIKVRSITADSCTLKIDNFTITVNKKTFDPKKHKLLNKGQDRLLIDGKGFWGTDGTVPT